MKISAITPKPRLFEDMIREDTTYKAFNRAGRMLVELKMSEKEILDLFANIEKGATAGGGNRTALGKGKDAVTDVATAISNAFSKVSSKISSSALVSGFDVGVDKLTDQLATAAGGQSGAVMTAIKKYREFAKAHPIMQGAIYAGLIALTGLSGAGLGGAVILGGIKAFDKLLLGNKASSSLWSGFLTGATAYGIGQAQQAFGGGGTPGTDSAGAAPPGGGEPLAPGTPVTPQSQMNADDIANGSGGPDVPALDAETMANNAANAKAYGIDGADSTADMNNAILKTADTTNVADYGQLGAAGNGTEYTVVKGDTLSDLAKANNVSVDDMMKANPDITNPDVLKAGQEIKIPSATSNAVYDQGVGTASDTAAKVASGQYTPNPAGAGPEQLSGPGVTPNTGGAVGEPVGLGAPKPPAGQEWYDDDGVNKLRPIQQNIPPAPTLKPGPGQQYAESRRNMNNMLMEAIVATTNSIKPFKAKTINLSAMIDRQATAHVWMLGESLGRNYKHRYHITEAGIDNIFKNVERYQRHIQIVVAESLLNELDAPPAGVGASSTRLGGGKNLGVTAAPTASGPDRANIPAQLRPDMPDAAAPAKKPGLLGRMWAGAKNIGHQFTTKTTAEKLKMNWHVKGKPTESDEIATFLQGQGVPANVISDVFTQSKLPVPQAVTAAAAVPAPSTAATPAGPGNPDTPAVAKAKAAMGIKPDAPATPAAATPATPTPATPTDAAATPAGAPAIPAGATATPADAAATPTEPSGKGAAATAAGPKPGQEMEMPGTTSKFKYSPNWIGADSNPAPEAVSTVLTQLATGTDKADLNTTDLLRARRSLGMQENKKRYGRNLTSPASKAMRMFENFVEKTKVETKPLTESNTRPLIKRALTEQKAKQSIKITKKAVIQRNEVIDLWKKMPG